MNARPEQITVTDPASQSICTGDTASFSVTATGQPTLLYQWRKNGVNISNGGTVSGATTATLTINPAAAGDSGNYDVSSPTSTDSPSPRPRRC